MVESTYIFITSSCFDDHKISYHKWTPLNVKTDLIEEGLDPWNLEFNTSQKNITYLHVYYGSYNGTNFQMRWIKRKDLHFLVLYWNLSLLQFINLMINIFTIIFLTLMNGINLIQKKDIKNYY